MDPFVVTGDMGTPSYGQAGPQDAWQIADVLPWVDQGGCPRRGVRPLDGQASRRSPGGGRSTGEGRVRSEAGLDQGWTPIASAGVEGA